MSKISLKHSGGNVVSLNSPTSAPTSADVAFKLPNADGTSGQVLKTDGSGNLSFGADTGGKILQVQQFAKSDVVSAQPGQTYTDISGFTTSITPSSTSSKILVQIMMFVVGFDTTALRLFRDSTSILEGNTATGVEPVAAGVYQSNSSTGSNYFGAQPTTLIKLDTPSTTSAVTYKMQWKSSNNSNTLYLNRNLSDTNQYSFRTVSTITLMEVGA